MPFIQSYACFISSLSGSSASLPRHVSVLKQSIPPSSISRLYDIKLTIMQHHHQHKYLISNPERGTRKLSKSQLHTWYQYHPYNSLTNNPYQGSTCFSSFSIPFIIFVPFFSLPPSRNSDPGSHSRRFSPPPHYARFVPCIFIVTRLQLFLPSSTRVELL